MKRHFPTRTLALFLSMGLALPSPALALRTAGLEENNAKDDFLRQLGVNSPTPSAAGLEEEDKRGLFGLSLSQADELVRIFGRGKIPEDLPATIIALSWLIDRLSFDPKTDENKRDLLNAKSLKEVLEARLETQRKKAYQRMFGRWAGPIAVILGLVVWKGSELFQPAPPLPPPVPPEARQEAVAPAPFQSTVPKKIPADLTRAEITEETVSAALQVMLRDPLGPRSLEGLYAAAYLQTTDEKGRRLYIRAGQDRVGSDGLVTFPAKPPGFSAGRGKPYVILLSSSPREVKEMPARTSRLPLGGRFDMAVEIQPNGSATVLRDELYSVLPESIQIEKGTLRLKNLPALEGKWIVPYQHVFQRDHLSSWKQAAPPGQVLEGKVSFPVVKGEWVKNGIHFVVFDSEKQAQSAPLRTQGIMKLEKVRWIMETTKNFPGSLIIALPNLSQSGLEETDPEVKQLLAEYLQKGDPSERLSLMAQRLPPLTSLQRRQWFQALVWLNPKDVSPLLTAAFLQQDSPARLVRDQILETLREDETDGRSLHALVWLLADFQSGDLEAVDRVVSEEFRNDPQGDFWFLAALAVADANHESILRNLDTMIQQAGKSPEFDLELFRRLADAYLDHATGYQELGGSMWEALAQVDRMFSALGLAVAAELRPSRAMVLGERGVRQRISREIYEKLHSAFIAKLKQSSFSTTIARTLQSLMRLENIYGYYLNLSPDRSVTGLDHFRQAREYRTQATDLRQAELDQLGLGSLDAGLEEGDAYRLMEDIAAAQEGTGMLVIGAEALERRAALAGLVRFAPFRNRVIYYGVGPSWEEQLRAMDSAATVISGNDSVELLTVLLGKPEADRVAVLGNAGLEEFLRRTLPPSMNVTGLGVGTSFFQILSALGAAASALKTIDAAGLEEALAQLTAA